MASQFTSTYPRTIENSLANGSLTNSIHNNNNRPPFRAKRRLNSFTKRNNCIFTESNTSTSIENCSNVSDAMSSDTSLSPKFPSCNSHLESNNELKTSQMIDVINNKRPRGRPPLNLKSASKPPSKKRRISSSPSDVMPSSIYDTNEDDITWTASNNNKNNSIHSQSVNNINIDIDSECIGTDIVLLDVQEFHQLAFQDSQGNLMIPQCVRQTNIDYKLPCSASIFDEDNGVENLVETMVPYYYQEAFNEEKEAFLNRGYTAISTQLKRVMARQINAQMKTAAPSINGITKSSSSSLKTYTKINNSTTTTTTTTKTTIKSTPTCTLQEWREYDNQVINLRQATFNMLMRLLPDLDVTPSFDCNTKQVDDMVVGIIHSLYQSSSSSTSTTLKPPHAVSTRKKYAVVSLCQEPLLCLKRLQNNVITLLGLICPFCDIPSNTSQNELLRLIKHVQLASSSDHF